MKKATVPKNIAISRHVITFFSKVASGSERPTTAIMKAMAVPIGIPLATNTSMTGTMPAALAYIGTARITESGRQTSCPSTCIARKILRAQSRA